MEIKIKKNDGTMKTITANVERSADFKEQMDEALETISFTLSPLTNEETIEPGTLVSLTEGGREHCYVVVSDSTEQVSRTPKLWAHHIQCTQRVRELSFRVVRGVDLSQPYQSSRKDAFTSFYYVFQNDNVAPSLLVGKNATYKRSLSLAKSSKGYTKEKIKSATITAYRYGVYTITGATKRTNETNPGIKGNDTLLMTINMAGRDTYTLSSSEIDELNGAIESGDEISITRGDMDKSADKGNVNNYVGDIVFYRLSAETYFYTYYDVVHELILNAKQPDMNGLTTEKPCDFPSLSAGKLGDKLSKIIAPDFQFQEGITLYEALAEVFRSLGGKPTLDINGELGIEYFNDKSPINSNFLSESSFVSEARQIKDNRRAESIITPYQNGVADYSTKAPANGFMTPRCKEIGVPSKNDWYILTNNRISQVKKVTTKLPTQTSFKIGSKVEVMTIGDLSELDITDFVFDDETYGALDEDPTYKKPVVATQSNSLRYQKNQDGIYVGNVTKGFFGTEVYSYKYTVIYALTRLFGGSWVNSEGVGENVITDVPTLSNSPYEWQFSCEYYPIASGVVSVSSPNEKTYGGKNHNEMILSQASGIVSLPKLGASVYGTISSIGNETRLAVYKTNVVSNTRFFKGQWINDGGSLWVVTSVKETMLGGDMVKSELMLSKDYAIMPDRIKLDRAVRMSTISTELTLKKEHIIKQYVKFYSYPANYLLNNSLVGFKNGTFGDVSDPYSSLVMSPFGLGGKDISSMKIVRKRSFPIVGTIKEAVYAPIIKYSAGNTATIEGVFTSPKSAGNYVQKISNWLGVDLSSKPAIYTDSYGFLDVCDIELCSSDYDSGSSSYPLANSGCDMVMYEDVEARKKPNDILGFNISFSFLGAKSANTSVIIYPSFASHCSFVNGGKTFKPRLFALPNTESPYSISDVTAKGIEMSFDKIIFQRETDSILTSIVKDTIKVVNASGKAISIAGYNGWLLADENGTPLIAVNGENSTATLHVVPMQNRY